MSSGCLGQRGAEERGVTANLEHEISLGDNENALGLIVVMIEQLGEYPKEQ